MSSKSAPTLYIEAPMSDNETKTINHSHIPGVNKTFTMRHPKFGTATVGDWQEEEFLAAGWERAKKAGRPPADAPAATGAPE